MSVFKGNSRKVPGRELSGYTLAEMLIVMSIIIIVLLSLPPMTKKVFKLEESPNIHGRFECYWETTNGSKVLKGYRAEMDRNGEITSETLDFGTYCKVTLPSKPLYFMIIAIGGGGAGAKIESGLSALEDAETETAVSYLYTTSAALYPDWVKYLDKKYTNFPSAFSTATQYGDQFDVSKTWKNQVIRYRLSGTAAKPVSMFVPQLPADVSYMHIIPGKGGNTTSSGDGSGEDGGDTTVDLYYVNGRNYRLLSAKGGTGGDGSVDGKTAVMLVGGKPGDFDLTTKASVATKDSGFSDILIPTTNELGSKITYSAGYGGAGETQFVTDTSGFALYEYDNKEGLYNLQRLGSSWENITSWLPKDVYKNFGLESNCTTSTDTVEPTRPGYCTSTGVSGNNYYYNCTVGTNTVEDNSSCSDTDNCSFFTLTYNSGTGTATFSPNPTSYSSSSKFYDCTFSFSTAQISCKTKLSDTTVHDCTTPSTGTTCASGVSPTGSGKSAKCSAEAGGDGAVVIVW